jgi:hypothetical protein
VIEPPSYITKQFNGKTWMLIAGYRAWDTATLGALNAGVRGLFTTHNAPVDTFNDIFSTINTSGQHYANSNTWDVTLSGYLLEGYQLNGTSRNIQGQLMTDRHTWTQLGTKDIEPNYARAFNPTNAQLFNGSGEVTVGSYCLLTSSGTSTPLAFGNDTGDFIMLGVTTAPQGTDDALDTTFNSGTDAIGLGLSDGTGTGYNVRDHYSARGNPMAITTISGGYPFGGRGGQAGKNETGWVMVWGMLVPPDITANPTSGSFPVGYSITLSPSVEGSEPLAYQWRFNEVAITHATNATFTINSFTTNLIGRYDLVVTNYAGTATSSVATLTIGKGVPVANPWPVASAINFGQSLTASVLTGGSAAIGTNLVGGSFAFVEPAKYDHANRCSAQPCRKARP